MRIKAQAAKQLRHNVRFQALELLYQIDWQGQYSNVILNRHLSSQRLKPQDQGLLVQLVYGTLQHRLTLDYYLAPLLEGKKVEDWVRSLLRLTVYQLVYLDRIPDHAALNEAVQIAKLNGHAGLGRFVNGVLRQFLRQDLPSLEDIADPITYLSVRYSLAPWIVRLLVDQYEASTLEALLESVNRRPRLTFRMQAVPEARESLLDSLRQAGYQVAAGRLSPYAIESLDGRLLESEAFLTGQLTAQDESSMLVGPLGQPQAGQRILDACSAPGGKATHIAWLLGQGHLDALDISAAKLSRVADHMQRLGLMDQSDLTIRLTATDALDFEPDPDVRYDVIYLDAPCSGLGLLRRKPEIKYHKEAGDITALSQIQAQLLDHLVSFLKPGGTLVYSTCTLARAENQDQIVAFLAKHPEMQLAPIGEGEVAGAGSLLSPEGQLEIRPHDFETDGFFIARLSKSLSPAIHNLKEVTT